MPGVEPPSPTTPNIGKVPSSGFVKFNNIAGTTINVLGAIGTAKFAYDYGKSREFLESAMSGEYFEKFWMEIGSYPEGASIQMFGRTGTIVMNKGLAIQFDDGTEIRMSHSKQAGFGMAITGYENGQFVEYLLDKNVAKEMAEGHKVGPLM